MARFHVHHLDHDLAVDVQSNLLDGLHTRVVVPLIPQNEISRLIPRLNPIFQINGVIYVLMTEFMAAVPAGELGSRVADLSAHADEITAATDFLFQGF